MIEKCNNRFMKILEDKELGHAMAHILIARFKGCLPVGVDH